MVVKGETQREMAAQGWHTFIIQVCVEFSTLVYSCFMPVCSKVKTITTRGNGRPDALLNEVKAECNSASGRPWYGGVIV